MTRSKCSCRESGRPVEDCRSLRNLIISHLDWDVPLNSRTRFPLVNGCSIIGMSRCCPHRGHCMTCTFGELGAARVPQIVTQVPQSRCLQSSVVEAGLARHTKQNSSSVHFCQAAWNSWSKQRCARAEEPYCLSSANRMKVSRT